MAFEMFCVEIPNGRDELVRLNQFMTSHRVVSKHQQMVERDGIPYMLCWLEYNLVHDGRGEESKTMQPAAKKDVWESLSQEDRARFEKLRELRTALAEAEHVKPFVIFTNDQLGEMITRRVTSLEGLRKVNGVGDSRVDKYGQKFMEILNGLWKTEENSVQNDTADEETAQS